MEDLMVHVHAPHYAEAFLRYSVGLVLWASSALLTIFLFISIAGDNVERQIFMVILAIALEGTKILSWRMGHSARVLACFLLALSCFASFGAALQTVEAAQSSFVAGSLNATKQSSSYQFLVKEEEGIDREIIIAIDRLGKLPPNFTTAAAKLAASLQELRDRRSMLQKALDNLEASSATTYQNSNLFVLLGRALGVAPETVLLVLLVFLSACIEAGALILTGPDGAAGRIDGSKGIQEWNGPLRPISYQGPIGPMEFLEAAREGSDLPYLHGRDVTARLLGISSYRAKVLVRELIIRGDVTVEGKRLKLTEEGRSGALHSLTGRTQEKG
jgi:hypothetical protein